MTTILFLTANPSDPTLDPLQLDEEFRAIDEALQKGTFRDAFELKFHGAVRTTDLQGLLLRHKPDIVHFSGHGSQGAILLEDKWGDRVDVSPHNLRTIFRAMKGKIRCVVLNACYSETQAADIVEDVGILIGTTADISDSAALAFSASFYQALAYGEDVQSAYDLGRTQIQMDLSADADVLRLLNAQNVVPSEVRFAQPEQQPPPSPEPQPSLSLEQQPQPQPSGPPHPPIWKRWEIVIPAIATILAALIGIIPPLVERIWPEPTPTMSIAIALPTITATPTLTPSPTPTQRVTPTPLMPATGFNIAVAGFLEETSAGELIETNTSKAISEWLYEAVSKEVAQLPTTLRYGVRGPDAVTPVDGVTVEERARNGQGFADRNNIALLIYGVVRQTEDGYTVAPEFYVGEDTFAYGSEIAGINRLGLPVAFQLPITSGTLFTVNSELNGRTQALRHIITGLAFFSIDDSAAAQRAFRDALTVPEWEAEEGQEVVYLLTGAAALTEYDPIANRTPLAEAKAAFERAYALNPQYSRALLGMGAVILQEACILNRNGTGCSSVDEGKLTEAQAWYETSMRTTDKQPSYFVDLKAAFGLGQVELLGGEYAVAGFDLDQARTYFKQVIEQGNGFSSPMLVWYVGSAYGYMGRIAYVAQDYEQMVVEYQRANEILSNLVLSRSPATIARIWANIGFAERKQGKIVEAKDAYCRAVEVGNASPVKEKNASAAELAGWTAQCNPGG